MFEELQEPAEYFTRLRGRVQGPFTAEQLQALHQRGQFSRAHEVSDDRVNWRSAASLTNVFVAPKVRPLPTLKLPVRVEQDDLEIELGEEPVEKGPTILKTGPARMVKAVWHYSVGKETYGPVTILELRGLLANGQLMGSDLVWKDGLAEWAPASEVPELTGSGEQRSSANARGGPGQSNYCSACGKAMDARAEICPQCGVRQLATIPPKSRMVTALLAIFLGSFGLHRFYLGQAFPGLAYNFVWFSFLVVHTVTLREGEFELARFIAWGIILPSIISFVEGVFFLCMSDVTFAQKYNQR